MDEIPKLLNYKFVVGDNPMCIWGWDLNITNRQFLENISPKHYEYLAETHFEKLFKQIDQNIIQQMTNNVKKLFVRKNNEREEKHKFDGEYAQDAAMAIRLAYSQGLETLFAFIASMLQAPMGTVGWIAQYRVKKLYGTVSKIDEGIKIYSYFKITPEKWQGISNIIHQNLVLDNKEKEKTIKNLFGVLLRRFASEFLNENTRREYNSIKHGLRIRPGGFFVRIGREDIPGVAAPKDKMTTLGSSKFGSGFYVTEKLKGKYNYGLKKHSRNWDPEDMVYGLHLISMLLNNTLSFLKILNGIDATEARFEWPTDDEIYNKPWSRYKSLGVTDMTFGNPIPEELLSAFSKEEILARYTEENSE